jgi:hypothetical protein
MSSTKEDPLFGGIQTLKLTNQLAFSYEYVVAADATAGVAVAYPAGASAIGKLGGAIPSAVRLTYISGVVGGNRRCGTVSNITSAQFTLTTGDAADLPRVRVDVYY